MNWRIPVFVLAVLTPFAWALWQFASYRPIVDRGTYKEVDLKAMSNFEMDQVYATDADIPKQYRDLDGQRVLMIGEMWAPYSVDGRLGGFDLCYSIAKCCFSGPPKIQHFVKASVPNGKQAGYYEGPVKVMGTLRVGVEQQDGRVASIYRLEVESVTPAG